jgi:hypothetical protein
MVTQRLSGIGSTIGSQPPFSPDGSAVPPDLRYIFYKPVIYRQGNENVYFRGLVRMEVSVDNIMEQIAEGRRELVEAILPPAFLALSIGTIGALAVAWVFTWRKR